jgi:DNA-binding response OmpR family regulator
MDRAPICVLLVEKDPCAASTIARHFARNGFAVKVARTLAAARDLLRHNRFDAVILELRLPDGRGESLLHDIDAFQWAIASGAYSQL